MSQYTMQYGGGAGAGTGRAGSLLTPLLPRIAVGATHSSTLWHGSREQAMLCRVCETHQGRRQCKTSWTISLYSDCSSSLSKPSAV